MFDTHKISYQREIIQKSWIDSLSLSAQMPNQVELVAYMIKLGCHKLLLESEHLGNISLLSIFSRIGTSHKSSSFKRKDILWQHGGWEI